MTIYTIVVNSGSKNAGSTTTDAFYNIDWSVLPDNTKFKVGMSFVSDTVNITSYSSIASIYIFIGAVHSYRTSNVGTFSRITNIVGNLAPLALSTTTFLQADADKNNKVWLQTRPKNNVFRITISNNTTFAPWTDNVGASINAYILLLTFETVEETDEI